MRTRTLTTALPLALAGALALAGCSGSATETASATTTTTATTASSATGSPVTVEGAWVKATDEMMTGVFATLKNASDQPVTVASASSPVAGTTQLHITVKDASGAMVMQETKDGFTIPAKGSFELAPGANHIMLMKLSTPVLSGVAVPVTMTLDGGATVTFEAQGREYNGAKETYAPSATVSGGATMTGTHSMTGHETTAGSAPTTDAATDPATGDAATMVPTMAPTTASN